MPTVRGLTIILETTKDCMVFLLILSSPSRRKFKEQLRNISHLHMLILSALKKLKNLQSSGTHKICLMKM